LNNNKKERYIYSLIASIITINSELIDLLSLIKIRETEEDMVLLGEPRYQPMSQY
jgi:hypothetical protein